MGPPEAPDLRGRFWELPRAFGCISEETALCVWRLLRLDKLHQMLPWAIRFVAGTCTRGTVGRVVSLAAMAIQSSVYPGWLLAETPKAVRRLSCQALHTAWPHYKRDDTLPRQAAMDKKDSKHLMNLRI